MKNKFVKVGSAVLGVSLLFLVPTLVSAFSVHEDFRLYCDQNNTVAISGSFTNDESSETLHVTVTDDASHITVDLGNVTPGQTIDKSGSTGLKSIEAGSVTIKSANVSDESVYSTDTVHYSPLSCTNTPTATPSPDFNVTYPVSLACNSAKDARFDIVVTNNESFPVLVTAKIDVEQNTMDWGTVAPGKSVLGEYNTTVQNVSNGTVHFRVSRADNNSVYSTKDVAYTGISCETPTATPTQSVTSTPTVTPTDVQDNNSDSGSNNGGSDNSGSNNTDPVTQDSAVTTLPKTGTPLSDLLLLTSMLPAGIFLKKFAR